MSGRAGEVCINRRRFNIIVFIVVMIFSLVSGILAFTVADLMTTLNLGKSEILRSNWVLNVDRVGTVNIDVSYAGYVKIEFTSTCGVYFIVVNRAYDYEIRYPKDGTTARGSFIIPVLPGRQYVMIFSPSCKSTTVVMDITYVY